MTHQRWWSGVALTSTLLLGSLVGCSGGDDEKVDDPAPPAEEQTAPALATTAKIGEVAGALPRPARRQARDRVVAVVDDWIDAAHVGGEWPRTIGDEAYAGFTPGATKLARKQSALTSAAEISEQVEAVTARRRVVRVDLVGARGRAVGATARVVLTYETEPATEGDQTATVRVRGRLMLTRTEQGWKVFGYDLTEETK